MVFIGPISSIFDISTFALMWFVFAANSPEHAALFQSGWFIESLISQTLIVHMIRTRKVPFIQSRASLPVLLSTGAACVFALVRSEEHTSELQSLMRISYAVFCLKKK